MIAELIIKCECGVKNEITIQTPVDYRFEVRQHIICKDCQNETNIEAGLNRYLYTEE